MIKIYCIYYDKTIEITSLCSSVKISGSLSSVCRSLDITMGYGIFNTNIPRIDLNAGTLVWAVLDDIEIFRGKIIGNGIKTDDTLEFQAFDFTWYLKQNEVTFNFSNTIAEDATKAILDKLGIKVGYIYPTGIVINYLIAQKTAYDAIMEIYTQVSKQTGEKFYLWGDKGEVNVTLIGEIAANTIIKPCTGLNYADGNLISFEYTETMENMVNRVEIYDSNNNLITAVDSDTSIKDYYGLIQKNYTKEDDKDYNIVASGMLHNLDIDIKCQVIGNYNDFFTGNAVKVQVNWINNLKDTIMYITSDSSTWDIATGTYVQDLTLNLEKTMDQKETTA